MKKLLDSVEWALGFLILSIVMMAIGFITDDHVSGWIWFGFTVVDTGLLIRAINLEAKDRG